MSLSDPLGDMLARIKNGQKARLEYVIAHSSNLCKDVLRVLQTEGYISEFNEYEERKGVNRLKIKLKYNNAHPVIHQIKRVSKPGRRMYQSISTLKKFYNGLGIIVLSTSKGVLSDHEARAAHIGGEVLCSVF